MSFYTTNARKVIAVVYTLRTHETSSLWGEFVNKIRSISVRLVSICMRRLKALNFDNFDNSHNSFPRPEYFIDFLCERWIPCQALTSVLCLHYRPETVHWSTKDAYTSEITFLALQPWVYTVEVLQYIIVHSRGYTELRCIRCRL